MGNSASLWAMFGVQLYTMIFKEFFMKPRDSRLKHRTRQRQKMSRKMILIIGSSIVCLVIALVVVLNITNVNDTQAAVNGATSTNVVIIPEQNNESIVNPTAPAAARTMTIDPAAQLGHVAKPISK